MKALVYRKKDKAQKHQIEEIDKPIPKENEVLVRVYSTSINAADYRSIQLGITPKKRIFGSGISGTVEFTGKNITTYKVGDEVIGELSDNGFGGLAEYVATTEDTLTHKPERLSYEEAAILPVAATTALRALSDKRTLKKNERVLVVGSSGGVDSFAVLIAKHLGTHVTGVCSTKNVDQSFQLGADEVIDYTKSDFTQTENRYDLILALNGNYPLKGYKRILNLNGVCVIVGGSLIQLFKALFFGRLLSNSSKKIKTLAAKTSAADLATVAAMFESEILNELIEKRYPLENAVPALEYLKEGHARGKVAVDIHNAI